MGGNRGSTGSPAPEVPRGLLYTKTRTFHAGRDCWPLRARLGSRDVHWWGAFCVPVEGCRTAVSGGKQRPPSTGFPNARVRVAEGSWAQPGLRSFLPRRQVYRKQKWGPGRPPSSPRRSSGRSQPAGEPSERPCALAWRLRPRDPPPQVLAPLCRGPPGYTLVSSPPKCPGMEKAAPQSSPEHSLPHLVLSLLSPTRGQWAGADKAENQPRLQGRRLS